MSEFLRTGIGRKLLEKDIPKLTSVLERIANQLEIANKLDEKKFILEERIQKIAIKEANKKWLIKTLHINNLLPTWIKAIKFI